MKKVADQINDEKRKHESIITATNLFREFQMETQITPDRQLHFEGITREINQKKRSEKGSKKVKKEKKWKRKKKVKEERKRESIITATDLFREFQMEAQITPDRQLHFEGFQRKKSKDEKRKQRERTKVQRKKWRKQPERKNQREKEKKTHLKKRERKEDENKIT